MTVGDHVAGPSADIDQYRPHLLFLRAEDDFGVRHALQHHPPHGKPGASNTLALVLTNRGTRRNDQDAAFQPVSEHVDRILDAGLSVDTKFLNQRMEYLPVLGKLERTRNFERAVDVLPLDLLILAVYPHHAVARNPDDVFPADADDHVGYLDTRLKLRLVGNAGDGLDRLFDVDDGTRTNALARTLAEESTISLPSRSTEPITQRILLEPISSPINILSPAILQPPLTANQPGIVYIVPDRIFTRHHSLLLLLHHIKRLGQT